MAADGFSSALAGFLVAFAAFNGLLAWRVRRPIYGLFAAAALAQALAAAAPATAVRLVALVLAFAFVRQMLEAPRTGPRGDRLGWGALALAVVAEVAGSAVPAALRAALAATPFAVLLGAAAPGLRVARADARLAWAGAAGVVAGTFATALTPLGPALGFAWLSLVLALGLAERLVRFEHETTTDPLTNIMNRRGLERALAVEWRRALRAGTSVAIVLIDVDHFKAYNDRFGHVGGDVCLRIIAQIAAGVVRIDTDHTARYGGEEFVLVLPGSGVAGAREVAERVRGTIRRTAITHPGGMDGIVTVSAGIAATTPGAADADPGPTTLLARADTALYAAKRAGRDRVAAADPGSLTTATVLGAAAV